MNKKEDIVRLFSVKSAGISPVDRTLKTVLKEGKKSETNKKAIPVKLSLFLIYGNREEDPVTSLYPIQRKMRV